MTRETHQGRRDPAHSRAAPADTTLGSAFQENGAALYRFIYAKVGNRVCSGCVIDPYHLLASWVERTADRMDILGQACYPVAG